MSGTFQSNTEREDKRKERSHGIVGEGEPPKWRCQGEMRGPATHRGTNMAPKTRTTLITACESQFPREKCVEAAWLPEHYVQALEHELLQPSPLSSTWNASGSTIVIYPMNWPLGNQGCKAMRVNGAKHSAARSVPANTLIPHVCHIAYWSMSISSYTQVS